MEQVEHRATPASEFGDEDDVDFTGLGQRQDCFAFGALVLGPRGSFLPDADNFAARLPGEDAQVPLLAGEV